jgi:nickel/cobalt exporter
MEAPAVPGPGPRILIAVTALCLVAGFMLALAWWLSAGAPPPPPPARNPFGVGPREATPAANGLGAMILSYQAAFYRDLTAALRALKQSSAALPTLLAVGFGYGVIHAAGPGHGKAVISAYILSDDRAAVWRGFSLSLGAALVQALVAIGLVALFTLILGATARQMNAATRWVEITAFAAMTILGLTLLWRKAGVLVGALRGDAAACAPGCAHDAVLPPASPRSVRQSLAVMVTAGIRPCAGAIIVLVFAASQGILWAGIATTFAMALGTALTTGALAMLAVVLKGLALRLAGGRGNRAAVAVRTLECLAAAFVAVLGALLLAGYHAAGAG